MTTGEGFLQQRVLQLLTEAADGLLTRELIAATRANPGCVNSALRDLRRYGLARKLHHGWWAAA